MRTKRWGRRILLLTDSPSVAKVALFRAGQRMGWHVHALYLLALGYVRANGLESQWTRDLTTLVLLEKGEGKDPNWPTPEKTELLCCFIENKGQPKAFQDYLDNIANDWERQWIA